jgi:hypothetical protein
MKTLTTSLVLSVMFLSAGAFAGATHKTVHPVALTAAHTAANVTVVSKNGAWPPAGQISVQPCSLTRCFDI